MHKQANSREKRPSLDDKIMCGVNGAMYCINYTTGMTKARVANIAIDASLISLYVGIASANMDSGATFVFGAINGSTYLVWRTIHWLHKKNKALEEKEVTELKDGKLDDTPEKQRTAYFFSGYSGLLLVPAVTIISNYDSSTLPLFWQVPLVVSITCLSLSFFAMRANYLPKQKSIIRKGWQKLKSVMRRTPEQARASEANPVEDLSGVSRE